MARGMLRTVRQDGVRVVKEFRPVRLLPDPRRPWKREDDCLKRLWSAGVPAPLSHGVERRRAGGYRLERSFLSGHTPRAMDADIRAQLAVYLASVHAAGVTTGDVAPDNLLVTPEGSLVCVDFGRGRTFRLRGPWFHFNVGKELARVRRRVVAGPASTWETFLRGYRVAAGHPAWAWPVVRWSYQYWHRRWQRPEAPVVARTACARIALAIALFVLAGSSEAAGSRHPPLPEHGRPFEAPPA